MLKDEDVILKSDRYLGVKFWAQWSPDLKLWKHIGFQPSTGMRVFEAHRRGGITIMLNHNQMVMQGFTPFCLNSDYIEDTGNGNFSI